MIMQQLEDGSKELPMKSVLHEGRWLSTAQWLEETANNQLPLNEPLKTRISHKLATVWKADEIAKV